MFPQCLFLSSLPSEHDRQLDALLKNSRFQHNINLVHSKQLEQLNLDDKYIDSPLVQSSLKQIPKIKQQLLKCQTFDTVIVAPLRKSLQTCFELFKEINSKLVNEPGRNKIQFYVEPLLGDRLDSTHAIGDLSEAKYPQQFAKYTSFFNQFSQKIHKSQWVYDLLPPRIVKQLPLNVSLTSGPQYIKLLKSTTKNKAPSQQNCLQTQTQFALRIQRAKDTLLQYQQMSGTGKKLLVIASSQVLNHLGATDFHQNGEPVNPLRLNHGQIDLVSLVINGFQTIRQLDSDSILPFCR